MPDARAETTSIGSHTHPFLRMCGFALAAGAVLLILLNAVLTPLLPDGDQQSLVRSTPYLLRTSVALASSVLLLLGAVGALLIHRDRAGATAALAFGMLFIGTALVVAVEWSNLFVLRPLAGESPEALGPLGESPLNLAGRIAALGLFSLGWLLTSISLLVKRVVPRPVALAVGGGFLSIAILGAAAGTWGAIVGNLIFGAGLIGLGREMVRVGHAGR